MGSDTRWQDMSRLESWAGEVRVNLIRASALVVFFANHLLDVYLFTPDRAQILAFHQLATGLVLVWVAGVLALHFSLTRRWVPPALKFVSTAVDLSLLTTLIIFSPDGPRSSLILLYFLIVAAAPLRMSLPLVWFATVGGMLAFVMVVGDYVLRKVGWHAYYASDTLRLPRAQQYLFLLALGAAGILAGQVVRQARRMVQGYSVRTAPRSVPASEVPRG